MLDTLLVHDRVLTCGIVETELYQGVRDDERVILEAQLDALDFLETNRMDYCAAGNVLNVLRKRGTTIPTPDITSRIWFSRTTGVTSLETPRRLTPCL